MEEHFVIYPQYILKPKIKLLFNLNRGMEKKSSQ